MFIWVYVELLYLISSSISISGSVSSSSSSSSMLNEIGVYGYTYRAANLQQLLL